MNDPARRISRNTGALVLGSVLRMAFSFLFVIAAARLLGVAGFGGYELAVHYAELFISLTATGLSILMTREIACDKTRSSQFLSAATVLVLVLAVAGMAVLQFLPLVLKYASETKTAIALASLVLIPGGLCVVLEAAFVAYETAAVVTKGNALEGTVRVTCGLIALALGYGIVALVIVMIISRCCLLVYYVAVLRQRVPGLSWALEWNTLKRMASDWRMFAMENWLSNFSNSIGVIVLSAVHGEFATGLYFAALKVLRLAAVVAQSYTSAVFPYMSQLSVTSRDALHQLGTKSIKMMLAIVLPIVVTLSALADRVILVLYAQDYVGAIPVLQVAVWGIMPRFLNPFLSHVLFARGEQSKSTWVAAIRLASQLGLACLLIPPFAAVGAAWSSLLAAVVAFLCYLIFVTRREDALQALSMLAWTTLPAVLLGAFLFLGRDIQIVLLLSLGGVFYVALLFALRILSRHDLQALQRLR